MSQMSPLEAILRQHAHRAALARLDAGDGPLEAALEALVARGRAAWPTLKLSAEDFVAYLAARLPRSGAPFDLRRAHAEDLWLCCACAQRALGAVALFDEQRLAPALGVMKKEDRPELRQRVLEKLFVGERGRILDYSGTGPLSGWLRVVVRRESLDAFRGVAREVSDGGGESFKSAAAALSRGLEADVVRREARQRFQRALRKAMAELPRRQRDLLWRHYFEQVPHAELGRELGAPRSTVAHWISRAREALLEGTRAALKEEEGLNTGEVNSLISELRSGFDISLGGLRPSDPG